MADQIGRLARPKRILWTDELPRTRSGKSCDACCATSLRAERWATLRPFATYGR
ncbi:MAG: hypothetical protein ACLP4R_25220 [Solirubrobacteraceae bacterium]